jgi:hypothetical protein
MVPIPTKGDEMKKYLLLLLLVTGIASADTYVRGYTRNDGTYVQPHYQSAPNGNQYDNYSSKGNVNPYTGQQGTVQPQPNYQQPYPAYPTNRGNSSTCLYGQRC